MTRTRGKILIVDDIEANRQILREILQNSYEIIQAADGYEAVSAIFHAGTPPDLVLLDVMMPEIDGFEVFTVMKNNPRTAMIPVIFITASGATEDEIRGLRLGALDYITKPFFPEVVRVRVENCVELSRYRRRLEREVAMRVGEVVQLRENVIETLAEIIEYRDYRSGQHVRRTHRLAGMLVEDMLKIPHFYQKLTTLHYDAIISATLLHDIGKVGIPDSVLLKPGKLTGEEHELMKQHTVIGGKIMDHIMEGRNDIYYLHCRDICLYHHERWDGTGYPTGCKGTDIPLSARIMAVADVYDALVSRRPYKEPCDHETAAKLILAGAGTQFDPEIACLPIRWQGGRLD